MAEEGYKVLLNVYDLSQGLAKQLSSSLLGKVFEGIWHTGIVIYGNEYYFGGGIQSCPQGQTPYGRPLRVVELGYTQIPKDIFEDYLQEISPRYTAQTYSLLHHNCNNFSEEIAQFLLGVSIPEYILKLPEEVMNSPMGALILPMIQQFETTLSHGGVPQVPPPTSNFSASSIRINGSSQETPTREISQTTTATTAVTCNRAMATASKAETGAVAIASKSETVKLTEKKGDPLGEARAQVQEEITKEFAALMAEGHLRASEAAAMAARRVMERHGRGAGLTSES